MAITTVLVLVVSLIVTLFWYVAKSRPKNFPPGPIRLPIFGSLFSVGIPPHNGLRRLRGKYGDIFSIYSGNYPSIVLNNLNLIKEAFGDDRFSARPPLRPFLERSWGVSKGLIFGTGPQWVEQRKFSLQVFREFGFGKRQMHGVVEEELMELKRVFRATNGQPTSVNMHFHTAIVNTLWTIVAGKRFAYGDPDLEKLINLTASIVRFRSLDSASPMPHFLFFQPLLTRLFPGFFGWTQFMASFRAIFPLLGKYIESHKESFDETNIRDLIDVYLRKIRSMKDEDSSFYKEEGERSLLIVLLDLFVAGGETASSNLTWAILYLTTHPEVQRKLHREIDEVVGGDRVPTVSDRQKMPYLEAFINETLRMATIGALSIFHSTSEEVPNFQGYTLPKDTIVYGNFWEIHHDPKIWGDPENFRPERFLEPNSNLAAQVNVFSRGKRACPGEGLARDELFLFMAGILQDFTFKRDESVPPPCLDPTQAATLRIHTYQVFINPRNQNCD